jgi:hypothetical protein
MEEEGFGAEKSRSAIQPPSLLLPPSPEPEPESEPE